MFSDTEQLFFKIKNINNKLNSNELDIDSQRFDDIYFTEIDYNPFLSDKDKNKYKLSEKEEETNSKRSYKTETEIDSQKKYKTETDTENKIEVSHEYREDIIDYNDSHDYRTFNNINNSHSDDYETSYTLMTEPDNISSYHPHTDMFITETEDNMNDLNLINESDISNIFIKK